MKHIIMAVFLLVLLLNAAGCSKSSSGGQPSPSTESTIAWDAPVYEDGTPVEDVAGYNIYYGTAPGTYSGMISTGTSTTYSLSQLKAALPTPGTYYLVVKARDADGNESAYSNEISRTF